jgi:eukaryotic-like serine/threonine-protein kinase
VGPYRLERALGRGGMGLVFLAHRADSQYEKRVAIKLLSGAIREESLQRFRAERQILAKLDHPHIARMLDGGVSSDGEPYFVMDYVPGAEPIDDYCDHHRLSLRDRIKLFLDVCDAVQYAHQFLVVHRDLKPSNVQVSRDGVAKLVDFGIAKDLLATDEAAVLSSFDLLGKTGTLSSRTMTPGYASPEQVRGEAIGTASDIYALGILLYELLTGTTPYLTADGDLETLFKEVTNGELVPPSKCYARRGREASDAVLAARGLTRTRQLEQLIAGDLDAIVCKATTNAAQDRYASADQLAEDLRRYLASDLVLAAKHGPAYRMRKMLARNRAISSAVASVVFGSLFLAGAMGGLALKHYSDLLDARIELNRARGVAGFLTGIYENAPADAPAAEVLRQAAARLGRHVGNEPSWKESARLALGVALVSAGAAADAGTLLDQVVVQNDRSFNEANPERVTALVALGDAQMAQGKTREAANSYRRALYTRNELGEVRGLPQAAVLQARLNDALRRASARR